jgi:hypothetical protein
LLLPLQRQALDPKFGIDGGIGQVHNNQGSNDSQAVLRQSIDAAIKSLGGPIHKTINWYMDSRGVFSDPKKIDINAFYSNLQDLVGPGADLIMEETWEHLQKRYGADSHHDAAKSSPLEKIRRIMEIGGT